MSQQVKVMKQNIAISKETRQKIAKIFKVTERHVFNALNLDYPETDIVKRIRKAAKENGGVMMTTIAVGEAIFFADGTMRIDFENGAFCEFHRNDGTGHIFFAGEEVESFENVTVPMIYEIRDRAASLR